METIKKAGVYVIRNTVNGKRYIGSTSSFHRRWTEHRKKLKKGKHENSIVQRAWDKYGADAFEFRPLLICAVKDLLFYEQRCLDGMKPEYNILPNAGTARGRTYPPEYGAAISARLKGKKLGPFTEHHRRRIADALRGKKRPAFSPEWIAKLSAATKGRKKTPEQIRAAAIARAKAPYPRISDAHKKAISDSLKGRKWTPERRAAMMESRRRREPI